MFWMFFDIFFGGVEGGMRRGSSFVVDFGVLVLLERLKLGWFL